MKHTESQLSHHLKNEAHIRYPDFDAMWDQIQRNEERCPELHLSTGQGKGSRHLRWKKTTLIGTAAVVLMATPVYAAVHYNWFDLMDHRSGIQSAMQNGLGQKLNQSVTVKGVTLTLDTAFSDDNRTVILYTLKPGSYKGDDVRISSIGLRESGKVIEGRYYHVLDQTDGEYKGYFETDWTPSGNEANVEFTVGGIQVLAPAEEKITLDLSQQQSQLFDINKDGLDKLAVSVFHEQDHKVMLSTALTFSQSEVREYAYPSLKIYDQKGQVLEEVAPSISGKPGAHGEYISEQFYNLEKLKQQASSYVLAYSKEEGRMNQPLDISIRLDKTEMLSGTSKRMLNIPLEPESDNVMVKEAIITPTQIRVILADHQPYRELLYLKYTLDVKGTQLEGGIWPSENDKGETELRFEVSPGLNISPDTPITLHAHHKVNYFEGEWEPITLSAISDKPQVVDSKLGGFIVHWTYYRKDGDLYVERYSDDARFGGINQTFMLERGERSYGMPAKTQFAGDGNNQGIDRYEKYTSDMAVVYPYMYSTEDPEREVTVPLLEEK
ncbi:DUF4179 domain-containing protein [Paenibacillus silvae]|uniref:DUF4179 domain-containing protein n=1 Tax=Paenibacillus silvae TaxID=1325358 RepID=A0A2W6QBN7_9BACL|nr:DUF4179 domain-containing protein [Paenibacillus silvae]PZT54623.1 hypothetical protein DN757_16510 [Paenibacillus silvae]